MEPVYVVFLNTGGDGPCSKVYGIFKNKEDAMNLCRKEAEEYAEDLYPKDYEYEKIYFGDSYFNVDTFTWEVLEMYVQ